MADEAKETEANLERLRALEQSQAEKDGVKNQVLKLIGIFNELRSY